MARDFPEVLIELAERDPRICGVSCDCWGFLAAFSERFPDRAIEVGIAEQNLIGVTAGLAMCGKIPFAFGMNPFVTMRSFEQIRTDLGYGNCNAKVIGCHSGGLSLGGFGCTHHGVEEIALMRVIPGMTVVMPAGMYEMEQAMHAAAENDGLFYLSLQGMSLPIDLPGQGPLFELGKARRLREGNDVTIIATGPTVGEALRAGDILARMGTQARVLSMHTVKPIDRTAVTQAAEETGLVVSIEEHTVVGGLGGAIAEVLAEEGATCRLKRVGLQDVFAVMSGSYEDLKERFGITAEAVVDAIQDAS